MLSKLSPEQQHLVGVALRLFKKDPFSRGLHNHKLSGSLFGLRAISADHDLRLMYEEHDGHFLVLFIMVGTHDQVYR